MLIVNGTLVDWTGERRLVRDGALRVRDGIITEISSSAELLKAYGSEETLDARGMLVAPGLICAHTHFYGLFARGMALPGSIPINFTEILEHVWWRLDRALTLEDIYYSALVCLVDAIRNGTTTLFDHHASPSAVEGSLDTIADAVELAGVRACLCYEVSDRDGETIAQSSLRENARFLGGRAQEPNLLTATLGLHASFTLSESTLEQAAMLADEHGCGFHLHVAEDRVDEEHSLQAYGERVVHRLARHGILGRKTIAAHCVHVDEGELRLLRETGTFVAHNPRSNMNNAVGSADVPHMLAEGILVGVGNDGFSNDMFSELKSAYLMHKLATGDSRVLPADQVMGMAMENNAALATEHYGQTVGRLSPGACADLVIMNYDPPTPLNSSNLPWHVVFGMDGSLVNTTIVAGQVLMHDRQLITLDEREINAKARELAGKLWARV